jgi:hypothetical protein
MPALEKSLRTKLENTVKAAREVAEAGARSSLEQIGVGDADAPKHLSEEEKNLRRRLRIHGRQLGDEPGEKKGTQSIERLVEEVAYEHWHRLLFASFLAENKLLMYPDPDEPVAVTISECEDMASDEGARNGWELAARYAARMLPQIFRIDSPVFELELPPESQLSLEDLLSAMPKEVFVSSDSIGWVYQFWQSNKKEVVNKSEVKIGARELPAVTQLFTEDYMVDFLLDNTLGAWRAASVLKSNPKLGALAANEQQLREAISLPGCSWRYLRFVKSEDGSWMPAAGPFEEWPRAARELKCLDPCMGSGHFIVGMFERLVALRIADEAIDEAEAIDSVIGQNLFGLEIDPRCTQIAAFNLAFTAWRRTGYRVLPPMNLACSGLTPNTSKDDWLKLASGDEKLEAGMLQLYQLFENAEVLGSLINPLRGIGDLLVASFKDLQPLLTKVLSRQAADEYSLEMAVTAQGIAKAAEILASTFTLVSTNVPYLGRLKQAETLKNYCESTYSDSKADLATCFMERCLDFCDRNCGSTALITPQLWFFLTTYKRLRKKLLNDRRWHVAATLGEEAWWTFGMRGPRTVLTVISVSRPEARNVFLGIDVGTNRGETVISLEEKAARLAGVNETALFEVIQGRQLQNPDATIVFEPGNQSTLLSAYADSYQGAATLDIEQFRLMFFELPTVSGWNLHQSSPEGGTLYSGAHYVSADRDAGSRFYKTAQLLELEKRAGAPYAGKKVWGSRGVACAWMGYLPTAIYLGAVFDNSIAAIVPHDQSNLTAVWCFCSSPEFVQEVRKINQKNQVANATLVKVPFDLEYWRNVASEKYPNGLPCPTTCDPSQWLFNGHPSNSDHPLQVAVVRLLSYEWPRMVGSILSDCPPVHADGLESLSDQDGIVCIPPVRGESSAADRLLNMLAASYGSEWNSDLQHKLLAEVGFAGKSLEAWLRDGFFQQHVEVFHRRPFIWHIWDGLSDGFSALVNYHRLDRKNLETLIYTYLGDWISRCESEDKAKGLDEDGEKTTAAKNLKRKLELILEGQAPYDIFVRWKPLHQQPIGWHPDINDGVRINIRPFVSVPDVKAKGAGVLRVNPKIKWEKDRGKEPERSKQDYPWFWGWDEKTTDFTGGPEFKGERFNDCHYTLDFKRQARAKAGKS